LLKKSIFLFYSMVITRNNYSALNLLFHKKSRHSGEGRNPENTYQTGLTGPPWRDMTSCKG
jgi:hypothetical protein